MRLGAALIGLAFMDKPFYDSILRADILRPQKVFASYNIVWYKYVRAAIPHSSHHHGERSPAEEE
jgi:hypothetical protein